MAQEIPAAERLVDALRELGVDIVFGLPGVHNLSIWKALARSPIRLVGVRHEQAAAYAADGYARATGRLGVALVTTGPGAANALTATGEAYASGSPVLVIATDIPARLRRPGVLRGVLHETRDQPAMFAPVTKAASTVAAAGDVAAAVLGAGSAALRAPQGPVYVGIPTDLLRLPATAPPAVAEPGPGPARPAAEDLTIAAALLDVARRPLIWAGGGALRGDAGPAVGRLAEALGAPVLTTYAARGLLPPEHPCCVPGPIHAPEVGPLWDEADVVVAIGSDLDGMMTQNWALPAPPRLVAVNIDAADAAKAYPPDVLLVGDARAVTERLAAAVAPRPGAAEALRPQMAALRERLDAAIEADDPGAARLLQALDRVLPAESVVVADMCIPGYWVGAYRRVPRPRGLAYPVGWGTLGFGFPAAIGAALAPGGPVVCLTGDGGFLFACGELATVVQEQVPLTIVLVDDGGYGMLRFDQRQAGDEPFGVDLHTPDFVALAAAFGVPATLVDGFGTPFEDALAAGLASGAPNLLVVRAGLRPPPSTSPRWHRRAASAPSAVPPTQEPPA